MSDWISLKFQEPPIKQPVLITDGTEIYVASWEDRNIDKTPSWNIEGIGGWDCDNWFEDSDITHWMPLPELPEKK